MCTGEVGGTFQAGQRGGREDSMRRGLREPGAQGGAMWPRPGGSHQPATEGMSLGPSMWEWLGWGL